MSSTTDPLVETAIYVYTDPYMRWMIPFRIVTALLGVVLISLMMHHRRKFVAHFNLTLLLAIHAIFNLLSCLLVAIDDIYVLYQQLTWKTGEDLVLPGYECYAWRAPPCLVLYGTMFSLVVISVERFIATVLYKSYERCPKWLGAWFGLAEVLLPLICTGIDSYYYDFSARFSYCSIVSESNLEVVVTISHTFLYIEFFALILFHISLFLNWRRLRFRAGMSPSERYQITENFKTVLTITPLIWCHFLIMMGSVIFYTAYFSLNPVIDPRIYPILEESTNQIYWHGVLLPVICFLLYRYSKRQDLRVLKDNGVGKISLPEVVVANHEKAIQKGW